MSTTLVAVDVYRRIVELLAAFAEPSRWNGLPVDCVIGLESGLIRQYCPPWNMRGVAGQDPAEQTGESTRWYASFWDFCSAYLDERFGKQWCLSPEQSLFLHAGNRTVPQQLLVRAPKGGNKPTNLPHNTSLMDVKLDLPNEQYREQSNKLRIDTLPASLVFTGPGLFRQNSTDARAALAMIQDASDVLAILLDGGHSRIAGRLAGASHNTGRDKIARAFPLRHTHETNVARNA